MEFNNPQAPVHHAGRRKHIDWENKTVRLEIFIVILGSALLLLVLSLWLAFGSTPKNEDRLVNSGKYQAIFLNGGITSGSVIYSTYFGHIKELNSKYVVLTNVYFLTTDQKSNSATPTPQLTKLGCQQLHSPYDEMVINRSQVAFWENLKDDGKVVTAIKQFQQQNPNGPNCNAQATPGQNSTGTQNTPATTPNNQ